MIIEYSAIMKNLTFFSPTSLKGYGGGEKWLIKISNLLVTRKYEVKVISFSYSPIERINDQELRKAIKFNYIEKPNRLNFIKGRILNDYKDDILYTFSGYYFFTKAILSYKGIKIWGFHDPLLMESKRFLDKKIIDSLLPKFDKIHILTEKQRNLVKNSNIFLLENTFLDDIPDFREKFEKFTVIFYGRHEDDKGIQTVKYIAENIPKSIDLIIAGKGSKSNIFEGIKGDNVKIMGFLTDQDLMDLISKSHLFLFPSYREASSLAILESLAQHTPIIYRPIEENHILNNIPFNKWANNDTEFLNGILNKYKEYLDDPDNYIKNCKNLPGYLMPKEEYVEKFIKYFIE